MLRVLKFMVLVCGALLLGSGAALAGSEEFGGSCAYGLSDLGIDVKTDCSIRWANPKTGKVYCFGNEEVMLSFLKNADQGVRKAEQTYAKLYAK